MDVLGVPEPSSAEKLGWAVAGAIVLAGAGFLILSLRARHLENQAAAKPPGLSARYRAFADNLAKQGKALPALDAYTRAMQWAAPPDASLYWARGDAGLLLKRYAAASKDYDRAMELSPNAPYPRMAKAMSLALSGRYRDAVRFADQAIRLDNRSELAYFWKAFSEERLESLAEAEADYGKAIESNPSAGNYYMARAVVRLKLKNFPAAKQDLERALSLSPQLKDTPLYKSIRQVYGNTL